VILVEKGHYFKKIKAKKIRTKPDFFVKNKGF